MPHGGQRQLPSTTSDVCENTEGRISGYLVKRATTWLHTTSQRVFVTAEGGLLTVSSYSSSSGANTTSETFALSKETKIHVFRKRLVVKEGKRKLVFGAVRFPSDLSLWRNALTAIIATTSDDAEDEETTLLRTFFSGGSSSSPTTSRREAWMPRGYELKKVIGYGAYGLVVEGVDDQGRQVAIKKVEHAFDDLTDGRRLLREITLLRDLTHPNIITISQCFIRKPQRDHVYLVMGLMESDLHQVIYSRASKLTVPHVRLLGYQLFIAIRHCHASGVLHRDVKPGNVLVNENCELRLCDFGLARARPDILLNKKHKSLLSPLDDHPPPKSSQRKHVEQQPLTGYVVTRWYRAPELLLTCDVGYGEGVDVWSAGCILCEMASRKALFAGNDIASQVTLVVERLKAVASTALASLEQFVSSQQERAFIDKVPPLRKIASWSQLVPDLDADGVDAVRAILKFDPKDRPSAADVVELPFFDDARDYCSEHFKRKHGPAQPDFVDLGAVESIKKKDGLYDVLHSLSMSFSEPLSDTASPKDSSTEPPSSKDDDDDDDTIARVVQDDDDDERRPHSSSFSPGAGAGTTTTAGGKIKKKKEVPSPPSDKRTSQSLMKRLSSLRKKRGDSSSSDTTPTSPDPTKLAAAKNKTPPASPRHRTLKKKSPRQSSRWLVNSP